MSLRKIVNLALVVSLLASGVWLLTVRVAPAPESALRQAAGPLAMAPGGGGGFAAQPSTIGEEIIVHTPVQPSEVNMAEVLPGLHDTSSQYDRWQRGEIDLIEVESVVSQAEVQALQEESLKLPPSLNVQVPAEGPNAAAPSLSTKFDSLDYTECCGGGGNVPPDPELAVGPSHVIAVVNVSFEIYNKSGTTLVPPTTFSSFFGSACLPGVFDPNVHYDAASKRYIMAIDQRGNSVNQQSNYCVAVSKTSDPLGSWWMYQFDMNLSNPTTWMDYPHAGVGKSAIYMGGNMFSFTGGFAGSRIWAFHKGDMYNGRAARYVERGLSTTYDTPQPLDYHGTTIPSGKHYFIVDTNYNGDTYSIISWASPFSSSSTVAVVGTVNLETSTGVISGYPVASPQSGGGTIQGNDYRPLDLEYGGLVNNNPTGWTAMTIGCNPGTGTVNCVRWAQIRLDNATVLQSGVLASNGEYRAFPDLAVNKCGEMAIGYTKFTSSSFPSVYVTGRKATTPANQLEAERLVKAGEITYTSFEGAGNYRWGDYTGMTVSSDGSFWYLGEYSKNTGTTNGRWGTYIARLKYSSCGVP